MWIDDLDHLSSFTINNTDYSIDYPDEAFSFDEPAGDDDEDDEEISEEEEKQNVKELVDDIISTFTPQTKANSSSSSRSIILPDEWVAEIKKPRSVDELVDFLKEELINVTSAYKAAWKDLRGKPSSDMSEETLRANFLAATAKKSIVNMLLVTVEDRSMDVSLARVLKVGQKFSYTYDFGSSTYINLRVIAEREGILSDDQEEEPILLLAQNTAPTFSCVVCGKPAKHVAMGYYTDSIAGSTFCTRCWKKQKDVDEGMSLSIINSPRVGVL